jgi:hypothetical protein
MTGSQHVLPTSPAMTSDRDPIIDFGLRWWWLLALGVLLGGIAAYAYATYYGPTMYQSTAYIQEIPPSGNMTSGAEAARSASRNYAAAAASPLMFEAASQALGDQLPLSGAELQEMHRSGEISIGQQRSANFIDVTVTTEDREQATLIADTIATIAVSTVNEQVTAEYEESQLQLQQQIDFAQGQLSTSAIFQRRDQLEQRLFNQQSNLIELQASYQQELTRKADRESSGGLATETPDGVGVDVAAIFDQQIKQVEADIATITEELEAINARIAELPADTDPLVSGAMASAYANQVSSLTSQYVGREVVSLAATSPLVKYGNAADPFAVSELKRIGFFGVVIGASLAAGFALCIDLLRKRRRQETPIELAPTAVLDLTGLMQKLEQLDYTGATNRASASGGRGR